MTKNDFSEEVLLFLRQKIESVEQLHILLLLLQRQTEAWDVPSLCRELRSSPSSVERRLSLLVENSVLASAAVGEGGQLKYVPHSSGTGKLVQRLADFYRLCPHKVVASIYEKTPGPIQSFSDAFRFKREKESPPDVFS